MIRLLFMALSLIALILFAAFVTLRLLRSRTSGLSIRMQIFLALASIVGAFAFGVGVLVIDRVKARATLLAEESARSEGVAIAALVGNEMERGQKSLDEVAHDLLPVRREVTMALVAPDGRVVMEAMIEETSQKLGTGSVSVSVPIETSAGRVGEVRVDKPTIIIQGMLADFAPTILVISLVLGAAAAIAAALIGRTIASPIEKLAEFSERVSSGERAAAPLPGGGREVMRLSTALDSMRRELEGRPFVETFAADLSHELKNPVAAIRASAELLADGALDEPEEARRFVKRILEANTRIETLLGELLSLARIEARGVQLRDAVDLESLAEDSLQRVRDLGGSISLKSERCEVRGDRLWLGRLLDNLLDNALIHGPADGKIEVLVERRGDRAKLAVTSEGEVKSHVRGRIFRRFVTTRPEKGGSGLGLSIVRAVADAHGGSVTCSRYGPPLVRFEITLPLA